MARASTHTLLSLDRLAQILGIVPPHFNTAAAISLNPAVFPVRANCNNLWWQYAWQHNDRVSREELARAIADTEDDIARLVGYYPAPKWIAQEVHNYPLPYRPDVWGVNGADVRGANIGLKLDYGKTIYAGRRAVTLIDDDVSVVYTDDDSDGLFETATITVNNVTLTDVCEAKIYFADQDGDQEWEIRPVVSKTLVAGTLTIVARSWLFIDPDLWEEYPTDVDMSVIDISTTGNFVSVVDVYREYTDTTLASAQMFWQPDFHASAITGSLVCTTCGGTGCIACTLTGQDGCFHLRDVENGIVVPYPATYDADDAAWATTNPTVCRNPDLVNFWYYGGDVSNDYKRGKTCDPLSREWAMIIAYVAVARLDRRLCSCGNPAAFADWLQEDLTASGQRGFRFVTREMRESTLGTRRGEVIAWRKIKKLIGVGLGAAVL